MTPVTPLTQRDEPLLSVRDLHAVFDTDGGHGEGIWTKVGNTWVVQATGVLASGRQTVSTNVYTPLDENSFQWKSVAAAGAEQQRGGLDIKLVRKAEGR